MRKNFEFEFLLFTQNFIVVIFRVYANNVLPELEYVSLLISESMTVREALDSILEKYR